MRSSSFAAARVFGAVQLLAACGPSTPAASPASGPVRGVGIRDLGADFSVIPEPSPPGFVPLPPLPPRPDSAGVLVRTDFRDDVTARPLSPTGVATYVLRGREGEERGRIAHVDDTASLFAYPIEAARENDHALVVVFPHVGEHGERLTRFHRIDWPFMQPPRLSPFGAAAIPRVTALPTRGNVARWLFTVPSGDQDSTVVVPVSNADGAVVKPPPGVVGARALESTAKGEDAPRWSGWLVRWKGAKGDGWSLARTPTMSDVDARSGPRWVEAEAKRSRTTAVVVGQRPDGACEADVLLVDERGGTDGPGWVAPTCDAALAMLDGDVDELKKRKADEARARQESNVASFEGSVREPTAEEKNAAEQAAAARAATSKEAPTIRRYWDLVRKGAFGEACGVAAGLSTVAHVEVVVFRMSQTDYAKSEASCVLSRTLTDAQKRRVETAAAAQEREAANRAANGGTASTCPYANRSLCR